MSITYQCERCGKWHTVREGKVGTTSRCGDCGHDMVVPNSPDLFDDAIDGPVGGAARPIGRDGASTRGSVSPRLATTPRPASAPSQGESSGKFWGGGLGVFLLLLVIRLAVRAPGLMGNRRPPRANLNPQVQAPFQAPAVDLAAPVALPRRFPDLGEPEEVEPGVFLHRMKLHPANFPEQPGHKGTLWLYLPAARAKIDPKSLPCVLLAPAGSRGLAGMKLEDADRPEHLPYVKAGFAVLAFSLDGDSPVRVQAPARPLPGRRVLNVPAMPVSGDFIKARGGLVNGRVAIEFLKARVPQVDPARLYVAGHDTAGTFALLLAENEPELKGCVAYAPIVDLAAHFQNDRQAMAFGLLGYNELVKQFSPKEGEEKLRCPVLLFHSRADRAVPVEQTIDCADRLRSLGKPVTLDVVDEGDHVRSMLDRGIPAGIKWLQARDAEVRAKK